MCVASMIYDHYHDKWKDLFQPQPPTYVYTVPAVPPISPQEIEEFKRLLERAREYDAKHHEPDCEIEEKREKLRALSKELGVEIQFPD